MTIEVNPQILHSPTEVEWLYIYFPMAVGLVIACGFDLITEKIPRELSLILLGVLLIGRIAGTPADFGFAIVSIIITTILVIRVGFQRKLIGGGIAKLMIATGAGLPIPVSIGVTLAVLFIGYGLEKINDQGDRYSLPGSVVLTILVAISIAILSVFGA